MKAYILKEDDFKRLLEMIELEHLNRVYAEDKFTRIEVDKVHRQFHYKVCEWIREVKEEKY